MKTTKLIKKILGESFPGIAFSVRDDSSSGCSSISIRYTDGPLASGVDEIAKVFEHGSFDGMEDIYEYDGRTLVFAGEEVRQVKFCIPHRDESDAVRAERAAILAERFSSEMAATPWFKNSREYERACAELREEKFAGLTTVPSLTLEALTVVPRGGDLAAAIERSKGLAESKALAQLERKEIGKLLSEKPARKARPALSL